MLPDPLMISPIAGHPFFAVYEELKGPVGSIRPRATGLAYRDRYGSVRFERLQGLKILGVCRVALISNAKRHDWTFLDISHRHVLGVLEMGRGHDGPIIPETAWRFFRADDRAGQIRPEVIEGLECQKIPLGGSDPARRREVTWCESLQLAIELAIHEPATEVVFRFRSIQRSDPAPELFEIPNAYSRGLATLALRRVMDLPKIVFRASFDSTVLDLGNPERTS